MSDGQGYKGSTERCWRRPFGHQLEVLSVDDTAKKNLLVRPMLILSAVLILALVFSMTALIRSFDREALDRERELVGNGIEGRAIEIAGMMAPQVVWADAVRHLDNRFDPEWARINIINYLSDMVGFDQIYIVGSDDGVLISSLRQRIVDNRRYQQVAHITAPMVATIRQAELRRADEIAASGGKTIKTPIQVSAVALVDGSPHIVVVSRVQPDFNDNHLHGLQAPLVIGTKPLDAGFLQAFAKRYLLRDLKIAQPDAAIDSHLASASLNDSRGQPVALLTWRPQNPGASLFWHMAPVTALIALLILLLTAKLMHRSQRMAQNLVTSEARAAHLAFHDSLTGLANRVQFNDRLAISLGQLRRSGKSFAVHCIDLDRFKDINDTYGHAVGDELLRMVAERMVNVLRAGDVIARLSGDEFAIIQFEVTPLRAARLAERLRQDVARPFQCSAAQLSVGCSIGLTIVADGNQDPAELLRQADIALYQAKRVNKGGHCFFEAEMDIALKSRRGVEDDLRRALDDGDLRMAYQPQFNAKRQIVGLEALLRWRHPTRGNLSPAYFVPIAEQAGLILALGDFTIRTAFADSWRWAGLQISINISASQIRDAGFVGRMARMIADAGIDPRRFDLEITEGVLLGDDPETHQRLNQLRELGFGLALDDFGTGYSSLSYLHRYPINKIKIDRSFITNIGVSGEAEAVIGAIVSLAHALRLEVVAEGVETEVQLKKVVGAGCSVIQGFLFSKALAADEIVARWPSTAAPPGRRMLAAAA